VLVKILRVRCLLSQGVRECVSGKIEDGLVEFTRVPSADAIFAVSFAPFDCKCSGRPPREFELFIPTHHLPFPPPCLRKSMHIRS
jgi:hypothetical protein